VGASTELSKLLAMPDPLLSFRWVTEESFRGLPHTYVEKLDLPFNNLEVREGVYNGSSFTYFPGFHNVSAFGVTLYEDQNMTASKWVQGWKNDVKDFSTGLYNLPRGPNGYKYDLNVVLIDNEGSSIVTAILSGLFPLATSNFSLTYDSSNRLCVEQQFSCDDCTLKFI
jgi:hypothetical protein